MTKLYFYGRDLIWKTVKLDWDTLGKNIIKAGTPIDENGNIANDAHCIGLVMEDVTPKNKYARAVYRGETKFDVLEANCGIALSPEVMYVLDIYEHGKGGGDVAWEDIKNRPFWEEDHSFDITWDGNVEGLLSVEDSYGSLFCKVSDVTPTIEMLNGATMVEDYYGGTPEETILSNSNYIYDFGDFVFAYGVIIICYKAPCEIEGLVIPEIGTYFIKDDDRHVARLHNHIVNIKTLDPKYLPEGVGGGVKVLYVKAADSNSGTLYLYHTLDGASNEDDAQKVSKSEIVAMFPTSFIVIYDLALGWYWTPVWIRMDTDYAQMMINDSVSVYTSEYGSGGPM